MVWNVQKSGLEKMSSKNSNGFILEITCPIESKFKWKSNLKFVIGDPENLRVQSFAKILEFPKFHVRYIYVGSAISKDRILISNL